MKQVVPKDETETIRVDKKIKEKARVFCGQPPKKYSSLTQLAGAAILRELQNIELEEETK